jgi:hypothetical protein
VPLAAMTPASAYSPRKKSQPQLPSLSLSSGLSRRASVAFPTASLTATLIRLKRRRTTVQRSMRLDEVRLCRSLMEEGGGKGDDCPSIGDIA